VVDLLIDFPVQGLPAADFLALLRKMPPSLYSIASSLRAHPDEVHLTGSGTIQEQFIHYLAETPQFKKTITSESTSNPMSDHKLVEFITSHFG
jgi:sulfite reductase alpha subunit-like flavoprotein